MKASSQLSFFTIGLALFSMFFGAGNLIFALFLGQIAEGDFATATIGFLLTAVLVPLIGVIAMVVFKGDYSAFFGCLGKKMGFTAIFVLLTVWIPLGSAPRSIALAYTSILTYTGDSFPLWLFSIFYCAVSSWIVYKKSRMLDALGYILTPLLLICLALVIVKGMDFSQLSLTFSKEAIPLFISGMTQGYNTMDLIASFFFSASIIQILRQSSQDEALLLKTTFKASIVAALLLATVYIGLICLAASHGETLRNIPREQLLVYIANKILGPQIGIIASVAVLLACFTTSIALTTVFADFLTQKVFNDQKQYPLALAITLFITFCMSITGLEGVTFLTEPILQLFYPTLIALIVLNVSRKLWKERKGVYFTPEPNSETL